MPSNEATDKNRKPAYAMDAFFIWLFGDVAFTVLPIATIALINVALRVSFKEFLLLPEWSFASIVLFGLSIKHAIELKVKYQKDVSYRLYGGAQLRTLCLIAAVLSLALVELRTKGVEMNTNFLATFQAALFFSGLFSLFNPITLKQEIIEKKQNLPNVLPKGQYFSYLEDSLQTAIDNVGYFEYAVGKFESIELKTSSDYVASATWNEETRYKLESMLSRLEQSLQEAKKLSMGLCSDLSQQIEAASDTQPNCKPPAITATSY